MKNDNDVGFYCDDIEPNSADRKIYYETQSFMQKSLEIRSIASQSAISIIGSFPEEKKSYNHRRIDEFITNLIKYVRLSKGIILLCRSNMLYFRTGRIFFRSTSQMIKLLSLCGIGNPEIFRLLFV